MRLLSPTQTKEEIKKKDFEIYKKVKKINQITKENEINARIRIEKSEKQALLAEHKLNALIEDKQKELHDMQVVIDNLDKERKELMKPLTELEDKLNKEKEELNEREREAETKLVNADNKLTLAKEIEQSNVKLKNKNEKENQIIKWEYNSIDVIKQKLKDNGEELSKRKEEFEKNKELEEDKIYDLKIEAEAQLKSLKSERRLIKEKEESLAKEKKRLQSQQQTLKQAFAEARLKKLI